MPQSNQQYLIAIPTSGLGAAAKALLIRGVPNATDRVNGTMGYGLKLEAATLSPACPASFGVYRVTDPAVSGTPTSVVGIGSSTPTFPGTAYTAPNTTIAATDLIAVITGNQTAEDFGPIHLQPNEGLVVAVLHGNPSSFVGTLALRISLQ
jgi:hypothetical protein